MLPAAPVMFSTTTGWPSDTRIRSATMRAATSVGPPAAKDTAIVIGRAGKDCDHAIPGVVAASAKPATRQKQRRCATCMVLSCFPSLRGYPKLSIGELLVLALPLSE